MRLHRNLEMTLLAKKYRDIKNDTTVHRHRIYFIAYILKSTLSIIKRGNHMQSSVVSTSYSTNCHLFTSLFQKLFFCISYIDMIRRSANICQLFFLLIPILLHQIERILFAHCEFLNNSCNCIFLRSIEFFTSLY